MRKHAVKYIVQKASVERFSYDKGTNAATTHKQPAENYNRQRQMTPGTKRAVNGRQYSYNIRAPSRNLLSNSCDGRFRTRATHNEKKKYPLSRQNKTLECTGEQPIWTIDQVTVIVWILCA